MTFNKELNKKNKILINFLCIIITILPLSLITGPFIPDLSITLVGLFFLFLSITYNLKKYYTSNFSKFFLFFYIVLNFTSFFSVDIIQSFKISFVYFRYFLFSLALWFLIEVKKDLLKNLLKSISIAMFILVIDGFYQFYFGKNIL